MLAHTSTCALVLDPDIATRYPHSCLFLTDLAMMALVWNIMNNLGEIAVYLPLKGATIPYFVERFVEPSLAFAAGWNYWYAYAILVAGMSFKFSLVLFYLISNFNHYSRSQCRSHHIGLLEHGRPFSSVDRHHPRRQPRSKHLCGQDLRRGGVLVR